jgi:hypothetical protein
MRTGCASSSAIISNAGKRIDRRIDGGAPIKLKKTGRAAFPRRSCAGGRIRVNTHPLISGTFLVSGKSDFRAAINSYRFGRLCVQRIKMIRISEWIIQTVQSARCNFAERLAG